MVEPSGLVLMNTPKGHLLPDEQIVVGKTLFALDHVLSENTSTRQLYEATRVHDIVESAVTRGINGSIVTFGPTTVNGNNHDRSVSSILEGGSYGLLPGSPSRRQEDVWSFSNEQKDGDNHHHNNHQKDVDGFVHMIAADLFRTMEQCPDKRFVVRVSVFEIQQEQVWDLLGQNSTPSSSNNNKTNIKDGGEEEGGEDSTTIRNLDNNKNTTNKPLPILLEENVDERHGVSAVVHCQEELVRDAKSLLHMMALGYGRRQGRKQSHNHYHDNNGNDNNNDNSTSNVIYRIIIESCPTAVFEAAAPQNRHLSEQHPPVSVTSSTLHLVDLSGFHECIICHNHQSQSLVMDSNNSSNDGAATTKLRHEEGDNHLR